MPISQNTAQTDNITTRAARNGIVLSVCICILIALFGLSASFAPAGILLWAGSLAMPVVTYKLLKRSYVTHNCTPGFAELWAEGIASFFLGSLLPALMAYLLLKYAFPEFTADQFDNTIATLRSLNSPEGDNLAQQLSSIQSAAALPTAADILANIISFNIVAGTALSFLATPFVKIRNRCAGYTAGNK